MNWYHLNLAALMLITGTINTISVKWADNLQSQSSDGVSRGFKHPFLQAGGMFLGEMMCIAAYYFIRWFNKWKTKRQGSYERLYSVQEAQQSAEEQINEAAFNPLILLPPALCDLAATSIQYIGLTLTYASSFQMFRGAVMIFTAILSKLMLQKRQGWYRWAGIMFVILGLVTVGLTDVLYPQDEEGGSKPISESQDQAYTSTNAENMDAKNDRTNTQILMGDMLIFCSQIIVAFQMVYEEKFITKYNLPALKVVGWEGTFGFFTLTLLMIPFYFIPVGDFFGDSNPRRVVEDAYDGLYQLVHNPQLIGAFSLTIISIAFFNFGGVSVTKEMSATTRMVLGTARTVIIWVVSLLLGWERFHLLQLFGFIIFVIGMFVYNDMIIVPAMQRLASRFGLLNKSNNEDLEAHTDQRNSSIAKTENNIDTPDYLQSSYQEI